MSKRKAVLSLLLAASLVFPGAPYAPALADYGSVAAVEAAEKKVQITNLASETLTIQKGEAFQLQANRSDVKWKSSDKKVVTVSKTGKLKGIKNGTATITLSAGKKKTTLKVTVGTKVAEVNVVKPAVALAVGAKSTIRAAVSPADASNQALAYQSADAGIAAVSKEGVVTARKVGRTKITVKATDGSKKSETVIVTVRATESGVRLQDDFYQAMNATTLRDHALGENQAQWNGFDELQNNITKDLGSIIDGLVAEKDKYAEGTIEQKIVDFYSLVRDMDARDKAGVEPLKPYIDKIDQAKDVKEFVNVLAELGKAGQ